MFDTVREVAFERVNANTVRVIAFDTCEETGAKSVADIIESGGADVDFRWISRVAADYAERSETSVEFYSWKNCEKTPLEAFDTGKARKLQSKIQRMIPQVLAND